jgi:2-polyprenyl-3-methyl-5-hydroxy-6-metoxy-1,4-benzoquinol methylase
MDLKELENGINPYKHWYYQTKKIRLMHSFKKEVVSFHRKVTIIDIGAGSGFFSQEIYSHYSEYIERILLVDLHYSDEEIIHSKGQFTQKSKSLPLSIENSFIIMMDVLEHIEDDNGFLKDLRRRIKGRNYFFVTVPAFQQLWSGHDVFLGHFRRYTLQQINRLLQENKLPSQKIYYQYGLIFPLVYLLRKFRNKTSKQQNDMKPTHPIVNSILKKFLSLEMRVTHFNQWFGLTCTVEGYVE